MMLEDRDLLSGLRKKDCMGFPHGVICSLLHFISKQLKVEVEENVFNSGFVSSEIA